VRETGEPDWFNYGMYVQLSWVAVNSVK